MVWAAIWGGKQSELTFLNRDFESKKMGYSADSYLEVLEDNLLSIWEPGLIFMQDNAPIHTAKKVAAWLDETGIATIPWPPYSPDLNPIEHAWAKLKETMYEVNPNLENFNGGAEAIRQEIRRTLDLAWTKIPEDYFVKLVQSMKDRVDAVIEAKGWYTKY